MARRTLLNAMVQEDIVRYLRAGATLKHAAQAAGIAWRTAYNWMEWGERYDRAVDAGLVPNPDHEAFSVFRSQVDIARNEARVHAASTIFRAAIGTPVRDAEGNAVEGQYEKEPDWKAALAFLERQDPAEWGRKWRPEDQDAVDREEDLESLMGEAEDIVRRAAERISGESKGGE